MYPTNPIPNLNLTSEAAQASAGFLSQPVVLVILYLIITLAVIALALFILRYFFKKGSCLPQAFQKKILLITVPKERFKEEEKKEATSELIQNQLSRAEGLFAAIGGLRAQRGLKAFLFGREDHLSFEIVSHKGSISFYIACPAYLIRYIEQQIHAGYPEAEISEVEDYNIFSPHGIILGSYLVFTRPYIFPIKTYRKMDLDPLEQMTNTLSKLSEEDGVAVQIVVRSAKKAWHKWGREVASKMQQGKKLKEALKLASRSAPLGKASLGLISGISSILKEGAKSQKKEEEIAGRPYPEKEPYRLSPMEEEIVKGLEEKTSKAGMDANIRVVVSSKDLQRARMLLDNILNSFSEYNIYEYGNGFSRLIPRHPDKLIHDFIYRNFNERKKILFNTEEMASLYHFPCSWSETPNILWLQARKAPVPANVPKEGIILGKNVYRGVETLIRILPDDRRRHVYTIGVTGSGKSVLLSNMAIQDIRQGEGVAVIDPHGSLIESVLRHIPKERIEDVIYFDPSETKRPIGLNMLEAKTPEEKDFATQEMITIFYKLVTDPAMIGPMFEHNMRNAMLTLMADKEHPGTICEIPRIFTDTDFQKYKLQFVTDPMVRAFWEKEMAKITEFHKSEMLGYLISKVGRFVENEMMRNIIGQPHSGFNLREIMDRRKILLVNLCKGKTGEVNSNLLGLILVSKLQMAALSRADMPEEERKDFYLYIDEFQNFITDSIATILAEARKYKLNLIMAHQYLGQLVTGTSIEGKYQDTRIKDAIFGNVGTKICFRIGTPDAEIMAKEFVPVFSEYDLINIDRFNAYIKLLINNTASRSFNMATFPPQPGSLKLAEKIKELSRLKYGREKALIEAEILERSRLGDVVKESLTQHSEASL